MIYVERDSKRALNTSGRDNSGLTEYLHQCLAIVVSNVLKIVPRIQEGIKQMNKKFFNIGATVGQLSNALILTFLIQIKANLTFSSSICSRVSRSYILRLVAQSPLSMFLFLSSMQ